MNYLDKFSHHLEFLGYEITRPKGKSQDNSEVAIARHPQLNNLILLANNSLPMLFIQVSLSFEKRVTTVMYEYLDEVNGAVNVARAYIDEDESQLILQTHWTGEYDKRAFGEFMSMFANDQQILVSFPDFEKIWV